MSIESCPQELTLYETLPVQLVRWSPGSGRRRAPAGRVSAPEMDAGVPLGFMGDGINIGWHSTLAVFVSMATATYNLLVRLHDTVAGAQLPGLIQPRTDGRTAASKCTIDPRDKEEGALGKTPRPNLQVTGAKNICKCHVWEMINPSQAAESQTLESFVCCGRHRRVSPGVTLQDLLFPPPESQPRRIATAGGRAGSPAVPRPAVHCVQGESSTIWGLPAAQSICRAGVSLGDFLGILILVSLLRCAVSSGH